jgi:hypothetical protein
MVIREGDRVAVSSKEEIFGTGEETSEPVFGGFRGHSGGQGACVVSSAQPKDGQKFPARGDFGVGVGGGLFPQVKFFKKGAITLGFGPVEVVEQPAAAADHGKKTTAGGEIFDRILKVTG